MNDIKLNREFIFRTISFLKGKAGASTCKISENIFAVQCGYVNFFIFSENGTFICIDSGFGSGHIKDELAKLDINPVNISMILLTHSDYDHFGGAEIFTEADVYLSTKEKEMIMKGIHRPFGINKNSEILNHIKTLNDGDVLINNSIKIRCILTPGHTDGSMSYLINDKYLFTGDTCRIIKNRITPLTPFTNMDTNRQIESIDRLKNIKNIERTFTGHYGYKYGF
ncbi:MAG: MBL fold metallo-hydrolase [Spirochaetes bacterium]|nr:MBL fold metallo-hydrolase [Spirochaetota bacterium]